MKRIIAMALAVGATLPALAEETPVDVVRGLFDAMRAGDGAAIMARVVPGASLDRLQRDGTLRRGSFDKWAAWVDTLDAGVADEQIFGVKTFHQDDDLATVHAPFVVSLNGEVKGCGVNQFTLVKTPDGWRVVYGVDKPTGQDCAAFRQAH